MERAQQIYAPDAEPRPFSGWSLARRGGLRLAARVINMLEHIIYIQQKFRESFLNVFLELSPRVLLVFQDAKYILSTLFTTRLIHVK